MLGEEICKEIASRGMLFLLRGERDSVFLATFGHGSEGVGWLPELRISHFRALLAGPSPRIGEFEFPDKPPESGKSVLRTGMDQAS